MEIAGLTDSAFVHTVIRKRPQDVHKGDCGRVLIVAGSKGMAGAAVFTAKSAIKCGSGRAFQDRNVFNIIRVEGGQYVTIVVTTPFACTFQFRIVHRHAVDDI